ncbi:glycosyltransferase family 4 protein [Bacteroidia bacterium]|nr:glycosyltransferase family 4 protein [Bacteroidia bacterium]
MQKKVLILTYYWPPSGGAGVQRWLKLSGYLAEKNVEVHVLTPSGKYASYTTLDPSLTTEIHPQLILHPTKSFEPLSVYARIFGKKSIPSAGFGNVDKKNWIQQLIISLRTNLFIPDPRKYWKPYAYKAAKKIIKDNNITNIITSSPPHSVQLIGLKLKKKFNLNWIVDFRDMWTDIYYYELLNQSKYSHKRNLSYEKRIVENADHIVTASPVYIPFFASKSNKIDETKFTSIPNGYDPNDFNNYKYQKNSDFVITYTGTISEQYNINPFLDALKLFKERNIEAKVKLQFVGSVYPKLSEELTNRKLDTDTSFSPYVPHSESILFLEKASLLLVCGPLNKDKQEGGIPAKVYEYLAARKPIVYIGKKDGFVAQVLRETNSGKSFDTNRMDIYNFLLETHTNWKNGNACLPINDKIEKYSRPVHAETFIGLLK